MPGGSPEPIPAVSKGKQHEVPRSTPLFLPPGSDSLPAFVFGTPDTTLLPPTPRKKSVRIRLPPITIPPAPSSAFVTPQASTSSTSRAPEAAGKATPRLLIKLPARPAATPTPELFPGSAAAQQLGLPSTWIDRVEMSPTLPHARRVQPHTVGPPRTPPVISFPTVPSPLEDPEHYNPEYVATLQETLRWLDHNAGVTRPRGPPRVRAILEARQHLRRPHCSGGPIRSYKYVPGGYGDETDETEDEWPTGLRMWAKDANTHISIKRYERCRRDGVLCTFANRRRHCDYCNALHHPCSRAGKYPGSIIGYPPVDADFKRLANWRDIVTRLGYVDGPKKVNLHGARSLNRSGRSKKRRRAAETTAAPAAGPSNVPPSSPTPSLVGSPHLPESVDEPVAKRPHHESRGATRTPAPEPVRSLTPVPVATPPPQLALAGTPGPSSSSRTPMPSSRPTTTPPCAFAGHGARGIQVSDDMFEGYILPPLVDSSAPCPLGTHPDAEDLSIPRMSRVGGLRSKLPVLDIRDGVVARAFFDYTQAFRRFRAARGTIFAIEEQFPQFVSSQVEATTPVNEDPLIRQHRLQPVAQARWEEMRRRWIDDPEQYMPPCSPASEPEE
ncbi:hypothetical protein FISHEDRAFT_73172 [Fistulina hepatica ATCC 64428]|uniref:Uncharacterized protein n=1 Tax=Fistulina hepatica ATCC 64428 TaxID=1128425 RepID=A0A0D7ADH0_9AGAR|nr:hypothetical protein FISHEDRAFT_73172 [Fistulina hepatica ATCC 64428]